VNVHDSLRPIQHQSCCWHWTLWCRDSAEPSRGGCPLENGRCRVHVRIGGRSRRAGSGWSRWSRWSRRSRRSGCGVRAGGRPNRGHGRCASGGCTHPCPRSHPGRTSVSRRCSGSCGCPTAGGRSGRRPADCVGRTARRPNRGHGRCRRRQRCTDRFGADQRPSARPAAGAWPHRLRPDENPPSQVGVTRSSQHSGFESVRRPCRFPQNCHRLGDRLCESATTGGLTRGMCWPTRFRGVIPESRMSAGGHPDQDAL
jgi:hypothetical protein